MNVFVTPIGAALLCLSTSVARAESSPEELMRGVLKAFEAKDTAQLKTLSAPEADVKKFIWPAVASRMAPGGTMDGKKFVSMYLTNSNAAINEQLAKVGGKTLELVKVAVGEPTKQTKNYRLLPGPVTTVRDEAGKEQELKLVGGILETNSDFKVATYYVSPIKR